MKQKVDLGELPSLDGGFGLVGFQEPESVPRWREILDGAGNILALDLSQSSTGLAMHTPKQGLRTWNLTLSSKSEHHAEADMRLQLKRELTWHTKGMTFDAIIVEDVFSGANAQTYRTLLSLNTVIDELILEGTIAALSFHRVQNGVWKKWLRSLAVSDVKYLKDKELISTALADLGYTEEGKGFQDRLDAAGMLIGYQGVGQFGARAGKNDKKITMAGVDYSYQEDQGTLLYGEADYVQDLPIIFVDDKTLSSAKILKYLNGNPDSLFMTSQPVHIGILATTHGVHLPQGGYAAFWKRNKK